MQFTRSKRNTQGYGVDNQFSDSVSDTKVMCVCPVRRALRPTAKLARDIGRGSQCKGIGLIPSKSLVQRNKYNNELIKIKMT